MGLTVDSSIIYVDSYRRARDAGLRVYPALHEAHRNVGRALVYSNFALMAGFSVLALSHFIPLVYFGLLVSLAMLGGLIGNLVFFCGVEHMARGHSLKSGKGGVEHRVL